MTTFSDADQLILVDEDDQPIGTISKTAAHLGEGALHRAFSVLIFNRKGELLLQQRSADKPLWPLYWSNSCCSHPKPNETVIEAAQRRIKEELGFDCEAEYLYKFTYRAQYRDIGYEHEVCHVLAGFSNQTVNANPQEVADWRYISAEDLSSEIEANPDSFTPWFKMEWQQIKAEHLKALLPSRKDS